MENSLIYKFLNFLHLFIKLFKNSLGPFISVLPSSINFFPYSKVFNEYGSFYLIQDNLRKDGLYDISIIKSNNGNIEIYTENDGKVWM